MAPATSSLPVPVSPLTSTAVSRFATMCTSRYTCSIAPLVPIIPGSGSLLGPDSRTIHGFGPSVCAVPAFTSSRDSAASPILLPRTSAISARESTNSTSIRGYCLQICSATSRASKSGRFRSSSTSSHANCANFASASAPPTASSLNAPAYAGSVSTRLRNDGSALAIRIRLRERRTGAAVAAMDYPVLLKSSWQNQSALRSVPHGRKIIPVRRWEALMRFQRQSFSMGVVRRNGLLSVRAHRGRTVSGLSSVEELDRRQFLPGCRLNLFVDRPQTPDHQPRRPAQLCIGAPRENFSAFS